MRNILYIGVDFEQYIRLKGTLQEYNCVSSISLADGFTQFNQQQYCLIILNLEIIAADVEQEELVRCFRRAHPVPIIALRTDISDSAVVRFLNAGADLLLSIHTPDEVLLAHMRTLINRFMRLNHMNRERYNPIGLQVGDFNIDLDRRQVFVRDNRIVLSNKEFELLTFFAENPERVLTEDQIFEHVWNTNREFHSGIAKPINRLRQKIEPDHRNPIYIRSVRGMGYQFVPSLAESCDI